MLFYYPNVLSILLLKSFSEYSEMFPVDCFNQLYFSKTSLSSHFEMSNLLETMVYTILFHCK